MDKRFRILAVDDELGNLHLISSALQGEYDILTAQDGHDAISQVKEFVPDLILLDVMMPEISGFDVCKIIKASPLFADIPVIFLTAMDTVAGEIEGLELGGLDYLTKPVDINVLKLRVRNQITLKKQRDLLQQQKEELERALARVKQLESILPLHPNCNKMRSAKILIVDDDGMNRKMLHFMLSEHFDNLLLACNGQEGLDLLANNSDIDLILMDLEMPVMDGREMLAIVKNLPNLKSIVVIIAAGNRQDAISTLAIGADDFITKPYDSLELSMRVTHHLQKKYESSERKKTEAELATRTEEAEEASRVKSAFLATMSHDIRTPISGVIGLSDMLLDTDQTKEQREYTDLISRSGENLLGLINDILDFSKIEAGKLELEMLNFDLDITVKDIVALFAHRIAESALKIEYRNDPAIPAHLIGDTGRISQIFNNLIGNAIKFTHEGKITINTKLRGELDNIVTILFEVQDTGIGIPSASLAAVFSPYTQAEDSTTRKYGGTGLGLAICKQLVELMEGEIGVTSEVGKGSTFWFTARFEKQASEMPLATVTRVESAHGELDPAVLCTTHTKRILLAEDNPINQKIASNTLNKLGYSVDVVANGMEAIRALELTDYDLVLMDCMMPEMDGFEASVVIRDTGSRVLNHNVPIIAMTANAMKGAREQCLEAGMSDYLAKPVRKSELADIMNKWLLDKE